MSLEPGQYERPITDGEIEQFFLNRIMDRIRIDDVELHFQVSKEQAYEIIEKFRRECPDDYEWRDGPPIFFWVRPSARSSLGDKIHWDRARDRKATGRKIAIREGRFDRA